MKKFLAMMLAVMLMVGFAGCSDDKGEPAKSTDSAIQTTVPAGSSVSTENKTTSVEKNPDDDSVLSVYTENYMYGQCSVTLMYPRFGDASHGAFDISMRNHAVRMLGKYGVMPEDSSVYEILSCDIKLETEYFVSAVVTGQIINPTAAHDLHFAYTVNAATENGKIYLSEELVGDVELIKSGLSEGKFTQSYGIDSLMDVISDGMVTYESFTQSWRSDYGVFPDMYFTNDSFGVVAELAHAIGGYAGFEIPYANTGDMINPVAKGLVGIIVTTD